MRYVLIIVGAHDGDKLERQIKQASGFGPVLLIEPVPWLFEKLRRKYSGDLAIQFCDSVIAEADGEVVFYAPTETANELHPVVSQLGSLNPTHAKEHDPRFSEKIEPMNIQAVSFETVLEKYDVSSIDALVTDTEGYDAKILLTFPFDRLKPKQIVFEHKHSDGVFHIGKNFARLIELLDAFGYKTTTLDVENCVAVRRD